MLMWRGLKLRYFELRWALAFWMWKRGRGKRLWTEWRSAENEMRRRAVHYGMLRVHFRKYKKNWGAKQLQRARRRVKVASVAFAVAFTKAGDANRKLPGYLNWEKLQS